MVKMTSEQLEFALAAILITLGLVLQGTGVYAIAIYQQGQASMLANGIAGVTSGTITIMGGTIVLAHMMAKEMIENVNARQLRALPSIIFAAPFKSHDRRTLN